MNYWLYRHNHIATDLSSVNYEIGLGEKKLWYSYAYGKKLLSHFASKARTLVTRKKINFIYWSLSVSRKLRRKPLTIRLATALGIQRHNRPSIYASIPDNTNFVIPHFPVNIPVTLGNGRASLPSSLSSDLSLHWKWDSTSLVRLRNTRIEKLTNKCSHKVNIVGPILNSCNAVEDF